MLVVLFALGKPREAIAVEGYAGARAKSGSHQTCTNDTWELEPKRRQIDMLRYLKARLPPNYRRTTSLGRETFATTAHEKSEETARQKATATAALRLDNCRSSYYPIAIPLRLRRKAY